MFTLHRIFQATACNSYAIIKEVGNVEENQRYSLRTGNFLFYECTTRIINVSENRRVKQAHYDKNII